jgi:Spy/CpxP family protein refolding chaperone
MKNRMLLCAALLIAALLPAIAIGEAAADENRERSARKMWGELNLSADQEAKFKEINSRYAPARRDHSQRIEELREKINSELLRDKPSRSLLVQYAGQIGEIQKRMSLASVDHLLSVKAVLTPEQFKKFTSMVSQTGGRRGGPDGGRGNRGGGTRDGGNVEQEDVD